MSEDDAPQDEDATDDDPFEALEDDLDDGGDNLFGESGQDVTDADPFETIEEDIEDSDDADPFADFEEDIESRDVDPFADFEEDVADADTDDDDVFVEMDVDDIDEDAVWEELFEEGDGTAAETDGEPKDTETGAAVGIGDVDGVDATGEVVVSKERYCERCEHFSDPPAVSCTHPGTEIRELVDNERFRVYDCPIVAERRDENGQLLSDR